GIFLRTEQDEANLSRRPGRRDYAAWRIRTAERPMNVKNIRGASDWFKVLQTTKRTQTAVMILKPGKSSGSEPEGHKKSDQVLLVLGGEVEGEIAMKQSLCEKAM